MRRWVPTEEGIEATWAFEVTARSLDDFGDSTRHTDLREPRPVGSRRSRQSRGPGIGALGSPSEISRSAELGVGVVVGQYRLGGGDIPARVTEADRTLYREVPRRTRPLAVGGVVPGEIASFTEPNASSHLIVTPLV